MFTMFTTFTPQMVIAGVQHQGGNCKQQARRSMALSACIACPPLRCAPPACPTRQRMSIALLPACPLTARRSSTSAPATPSQLTVHPRGGIVQAAKPASKVAKAACFGNAAANSGGQSHLCGSFKRSAAVAFCTHLCFPW